MPLMRRCSVRWYSSSSLRYYGGQCQRRQHSVKGARWSRVYRVELLNIGDMLVNDQLQLVGKLAVCNTASAWPGDKRHET